MNVQLQPFRKIDGILYIRTHHHCSATYLLNRPSPPAAASSHLLLLIICVRKRDLIQSRIKNPDTKNFYIHPSTPTNQSTHPAAIPLFLAIRVHKTSN